MPPTNASAPAASSLKQQAYETLKGMILSGELAAGTVVSVRRLASKLSMSRTPVHAAIERLESDGVVALAPQQGVLVREVSLEDIRNHYEIRQALESFAMRRLAGRLSEAQIAQLHANHAENVAAVKRQDLEAVVAADAEFHRLLISFLGNDDMIELMQRLRERIQYVIYRLSQKSPDRMIESFEEHGAILQALIDVQGDRAADLMYDHLEAGLRRFLPERLQTADSRSS